MNTKSSIICLTGLSLILSMGAFAVSSMADGYSDDLNWGYVNGIDETKPAPVVKESAVAEEVEVPCTEGCKKRPEPDEFGLKLTYEDEAAPITEKIKSYGPNDSYDEVEATTQPIVEPTPQPVIENAVAEKPVVYTQDNIVNSTKNIQATQQYPISVEYPITVQRDITVEQPVIVQQPVIMRRPVVLRQPVTVQQQPQIVQKQPVVMQQQPTYIQQQPMYIPARPQMPAPFYGMTQPTVMPQTFAPQTPLQMPVMQPSMYPQQMPQMPVYVSYPVQGQPQMQPVMGTPQPMY